MRVFAGIDVGGTNIKVALVTPAGRVISRGAIETEADDGPVRAFRRVRLAVDALAQGREVAAAGVGCAGLIDVKAGMLRASPNLKAWEGTPLRRIANRALGVYTTIDNDATSAAWGEFCAGGRKGVRNLVFITLGTGVGGGVVCDGRLLRGADNFAGEVGHIAVDGAGPRCHCGVRGCLEAYVGSYGLIREARALLAARDSRHLTRWVRDERRKLTPQLIADAARRGDSIGRSVIKTAGVALGVGIASLVNIFNPEAVVIGGGVSASFDLMLPHVERTVKARAFAHASKRATIENSRLGNDATAVGAAMSARDGLERTP